MLIQGCSGNGFHLRKNVDLAPQFNKVFLQGVKVKSEFSVFFENALEEAGATVVSDKKIANSVIIFDKFEQGRRIIAFSSDRRAREFLLFLNINYSIRNNNKDIVKGELLPKYRINIDRSYLYDPDFALGKSEEEKRVKQALYEEAVRLILLRIKYAK